MFIDQVDSDSLVKGILKDYRREADEYRQLKGLHTGPSTGVKVGVALIGIVSLLAIVGQFIIT